MDRRDFFKTILATPVLAPFLLASQSSTSDELFLIADRPERYLPELLEELGRWNIVFGQSYSILNAHHREKALSHALNLSGWTQAFRPQEAGLTISFRPLQHPSAPSFTLVRAGRIWDVRTKRLLYLWRDMNTRHTLSSCLTVASMRTRQPHNARGDAVRIYKNGRVVEEISLKKDLSKTFRAKQGNITVKIEQGKVFVPSSSCRHKICCSVPPVSLTGDRIVCAPNHFLLEIQGPGSIDTVIG